MIRITIFRQIGNLIYTAKCPLCGAVLSAAENGACSKCICRLPIIRGTRCVRCSKPVKEEDLMCSDCQKRKFQYKQGYALWHYNNSAGRVVAGLKYHRRREYVDFLAKEMSYHGARRLMNWNVTAILPVPLHCSKLRQRGFNQAELLAGNISRIVGIPVMKNVLIRMRKTKPQKYLDDRARKINLHDAFSIKEESLRRFQEDNDISDMKSVVLIDDVYTTGSTIDACADILIKSGIPNIYFLALCIGDGY